MLRKNILLIMRFLFLPITSLLFTGCMNTLELAPESSTAQKDPKICKQFHAFITDWQEAEALQFIKDNDVDVNCKSESNTLPLLAVNRTLHKEDAKKLVDAIIAHKSFNPNAEDSLGQNSLFATLLTLEEIKTLVGKGADINKINFYGKTPLNASFFPDRDEFLPIVKFYLEHHSYRKHQGSLDDLLHSETNPAVLEYLIEKGAKVSFGQDHRSPLHQLGSIRHDPLIKAKLILELAKKQGLELKKFINAAIKINSGMNPLYDGDTALHEAVRTWAPMLNAKIKKNWLTLIEHLISWGADPKLKNKAGKSCEDIAQDAGAVLPIVRPRDFPN